MPESAGEALVLRVQTVLFATPLATVSRLAHGLEAAAQVLSDSRAVRVEWALGDCSDRPTLGTAAVADLAAACPSLAGPTYEFFGENLGHGGGQNRLAAAAASDILFVLNPDTNPAPTALSELLVALGGENVAAADARQIPLEHPKRYSDSGGDTSWVSGACLMIHTRLFREVGGFDAEHFFLHCDDVDLSWRLRARGWRVVTAPSAVVFHDKRLARDETWPASEAERYHQILGRLTLAVRWSRPDIVRQTINQVLTSGDRIARSAVSEHRRRARSGSLPAPAVDASVAEFIDGEYAIHRF